MASNAPKFGHFSSFSSYDGDGDDDSFTTAQSKKHTEFRLIHTKISQVYSHPVLPHQPISRPVTPQSYKSLKTYSSHQTNSLPKSHSSQVSLRTDSIITDEESMATAELLSEDGDSNSDSTNSSNELLSIDSAMHSQASFVSNNEVGRLDVLSSFSFFTSPSPDSRATPGRFDILSSLPFFSPQLKPPTCNSNAHDNYSLSDSTSSNRTSESSSYSTPVLDSSVSFCRAASEESDSDSKILKIGRTLQGSTTTTCTSTPVSSTLPSDVTICAIEFPAARDVSRATLEENDSKVLKTGRPLRGTPSTASMSSNEDDLRPESFSSITSKKSVIASSSFKSSKNPSLIGTNSNSSHKSLSMATSSAASQESPVAVSHTLIAPYSSTSIQASIRTHSVEPLYDDMSQSSHAIRINELKRKLRSMEIMHYRQKCVRSLRKSMAHYEKVKATGDYDDSSICSELSISQQSHNAKSASASHVVSGVVQEIVCFNVFISVTCIIFVLYKDSLSKVLRGGDEDNTTNIQSSEEW